MFSFIKKIWRIEQWWSHILPPILLFYYIGLFSGNISKINVLVNALFLILLSIITGITGYYINDLFDIKDDLKANKKNHIAGFPLWLRIIVIPIIFLFITLLFYTFHSYLNASQITYYLICVILNIFTFFIYSSPPIRFKKVMYISTITDALYSGTFFYLLAYIIASNISDITILNKENRIIFLVIICWGFLKGIRNHLSHLCEDELNDKQSGITTLATHFGSQKIQTIANLFFPLELICLLIIQLILVKPYAISIIFTFLFFILWLKFILKNKNSKQEALNDLHEVWLPIIILIQLIIIKQDLYYLVILHFIFFPYHISKIYFTIKNCIFKLLNKKPVSIIELFNEK